MLKMKMKDSQMDFNESPKTNVKAKRNVPSGRKTLGKILKRKSHELTSKPKMRATITTIIIQKIASKRRVTTAPMLSRS